MKKTYFIKLLFTLFLIMMCTVISIAQFAQLVAHYKLDETDGILATDASGNGFNGTISGTATWVEGEIDGALELAGDGNITLPAESMGLTSDAGSVACWINMDVPTANIGTIFWAGDNTTGGGFGPENEMTVHVEKPEPNIWTGGELGYWVLADPNVHVFSDPDKGENAGDPPVNPILMGDLEWHHVSASWGLGKAKLYIDGELIMEKTYASTSYNLTNIYLGSMANGGRAYIGKLDDVRIYSGVLMQLQIDSLYNKLEPEEPEPEAINENQINKFELTAFPNPASEQVTVSFTASKIVNATATIFDITGKEIITLNKQTVIGNNFFFRDVTNYQSGIYFVKVQMEDQTAFTKLIIK